MNDFIARRTPTLSKKRAVMDYGYRTGQGGDEDAAVFELPNEDIPTARSAVLHLDHDDFEAMGSPEVITVTIEPGDLLSDEESTMADVVSDMQMQRHLDNEPCPTCGGDRLRPDFVTTGRCHVPAKAAR